MREDPEPTGDADGLGESRTRKSLDSLIAQVKVLRETVQDMTKEVASDSESGDS